MRRYKYVVVSALNPPADFVSNLANWYVVHYQFNLDSDYILVPVPWIKTYREL